MSSEKALMQEAWRAGFKADEGFLIRTKTAAEATRVRFALYSAVKAYRNGKGEPDAELAEAINNCALTITSEGVMIQRKLANDVSKSILSQLGRAPKTVEEYQAEASMERVLGKLQQAPEESAETVSEVALGYGARSVKVGV